MQLNHTIDEVATNLERVKHFLWHGNTFRALEVIADLEPGFKTDTVIPVCRRIFAGTVTGLACDEEAPFPKAGDRTFQGVKEVKNGLIYAIPTEDLDGSSPEKRPRDFDLDTTDIWKSESRG